MFLSAALLSSFLLGGCDTGTPSPGVERPAADAEISVKIITANLMYMISPEDSYIRYKGQDGSDYTMDKRLNRLCALVSLYDPDVLMLQEVNGRGGWWDRLITGENALLKRFQKYDYVGTVNHVGGKDGNGNESVLYNQIYYNQNKYELLEGGTLFCRENNKPETEYDGDYEGVYSIHNTATCTYAVLRDKETNLSAVFATTHLCVRSDLSRCFRNYSQAVCATDRLYEIAETHKWGEEALPIFLGGDFNGPEGDVRFFTYEHMTEYAGYSDAQKVAEESDDSGTARIFGADLSGKYGSSKNGSRIDYIFSQGAAIKKYDVLDGTFEEDEEQTYCEYREEAVLDGTQFDLTDHLPVYVKASLSAESKSCAPENYFNDVSLSDTISEADAPLDVTASVLRFDSTKLLDYIGNQRNKGFHADIVQTNDGVCLRLMTEVTRVAPVISIDYEALVKAVGLNPLSATDYKKVKVEYKVAVTKSYTEVYFGASTQLSIPLAAITNAMAADTYGSWTVQIFDFSSNVDFWRDEFVYLGFLTESGFMAGDAVYVKSIEFLK